MEGDTSDDLLPPPHTSKTVVSELKKALYSSLRTPSGCAAVCYGCAAVCFFNALLSKVFFRNECFESKCSEVKSSDRSNKRIRPAVKARELQGVYRCFYQDVNKSKPNLFYL